MIDHLLAEPHQFDFFQAVRLLERQAREARQNSDTGARRETPQVGTDISPADEPIRFRTAASLSFAAASIGGVDQRATEPGRRKRPLEMTISFLGLTGPAGVLPQHYTQMLITRLRENDSSLRDFLDLFNHRLISLFYRAGRKYRFPLGYEQAKLGSADERRRGDPLTRCISCLVGMGTSAVRGRLAVDDEAFAYYAGHYAQRPRSASALRAILSDYFGIAAEVLQFIGQWLNVAREDQSRLPGENDEAPANTQLGESALLGARVWDLQSRFRIRLGPLTYEKYCWFLPDSPGLAAAATLIRMYVGPQFDFDVQPMLLADHVPPCHLGQTEPAKQRLGRNLWLRTHPFKKNFDGAAFETDLQEERHER